MWSSDHVIVLDTDQKELGGHNRLSSGYKQRYVPKKGLWHNRPYSISLYLPCRTAILLMAEENISDEVARQGSIVMPSLTTKVESSQAKIAEESKVTTVIEKDESVEEIKQDNEVIQG